MMFISLLLTFITLTNASPLICQYGGYCKTDSDCVAGNKCNIQNQYYSQCIPNLASYKTSNCVSNFQRCTAQSTCCDPGSSCSSGLCVQPNAGSCTHPSGYSVSPNPLVRVYKAVIDNKNRLTEMQRLTYTDGKLTHVNGQYYYFDDATEIGYFDGDFIPGTNKALLNYGGVKPTGEAFKQVWTPFIGAELYEYNFDSNGNVLGYIFRDKQNNNLNAAALSEPVVVTFCTKSFKECTGLDEANVFGNAYGDPSKFVPTNPLLIQNSYFQQIGGAKGAAPTGVNPISFHWTGVGPKIGGALVGGYEYKNNGDPILETGYYLPSSIAVNAKESLVVLADFNSLTGSLTGTHYGSILYFTNGALWDYSCSGTYNAAGMLVLADSTTCTDSTYLAAKTPIQTDVKRLLNYVQKSAFNDVYNIWS